MKTVFVNTQPGRAHSMRAHLNTTFKLEEQITMKESTTEVKDLVVLNAKNEAVTTSLKVAAKFGKRHDNVLRDIKDLDCSDDFRLLNFEEATFLHTLNRHGATQECKGFNMTRDGFTFLVMGYRGKMAAKFKEEYINAFNKVVEELKNRQPAPELASVDTVRYLLGEYDKKDAEVKRLEAQTNEMKPKAKFFDAVSNARGNVNLTAAAKMLGRGPRMMMELLRQMDILYYTRGGINVPAQRHINAGHFVVKTFVDRRGMVTPKDLRACPPI
jgi:anti-repressor protein